MKPHFGGELNRQVAESPYPKDSHDSTWESAAVPERVIGGDTGAHERRRLDGPKLSGDQCQSDGGSDHVVGVAAIVRDARDLRGDPARHEVTTTARITVATVSPMPADSHPLTNLPPRNARGHGIDHTGHFVSGDSRISDSWPCSLFREGVAVADSAGLDFDPHGSRSRLWNVAFNELKGSVRTSYLDGMHLWHSVPPC